MNHVEMDVLARQKELTCYQERNCLHIVMRNGVCISTVTHRFNGTEFSQEEFRDNL